MTRPLFEFIGISLDRNYHEAINLLFVSPGLYLNILKKLRNNFGPNIPDVRGTSFQRKRLMDDSFGRLK